LNGSLVCNYVTIKIKGGKKMGKKIMMFLGAMALLLVAGTSYSQEGPTQTTTKQSVQKSAGFHVANLVVCTGVENRTPVGIAETFSATTQKVYAFLDATKITEDTNVTFVWKYNQKEIASFQAPLKKGYRWRTFASKTVEGMKGNWSVELKDANGELIKTVQFKVE
jgi:hypothetical protein